MVTGIKRATGQRSSLIMVASKSLRPARQSSWHGSQSGPSRFRWRGRRFVHIVTTLFSVVGVYQGQGSPDEDRIDGLDRGGLPTYILT